LVKIDTQIHRHSTIDSTQDHHNQQLDLAQQKANDDTIHTTQQFKQQNRAKNWKIGLKINPKYTDIAQYRLKTRPTQPATQFSSIKISNNEHNFQNDKKKLKMFKMLQRPFNRQTTTQHTDQHDQHNMTQHNTTHNTQISNK